MNNSAAIEALNDLSARTYDAENGYKDASENVTDAKLKSMFETNAQQRYDFGHVIKDCVRELGGTPQKGGSIEGKMHQVWMDVRSAFTTKDDAAILKEVNRGEEYALQAYENAMNNIEIGTPIYDKMVAQRNQIRTIHDRTKNLETIYSDAE